MRRERHLILWVDDKYDDMSSHIDALKEDIRLSVEFIRRADDALEYIRRCDGDASPSLLIWDLMMGTDRLPPELESGLSGLGGVVVYTQFRARFADVPAILFTNATNIGVLDSYDAPQERCSSYEKKNFDPYELREEVLSLLHLGPVQRLQ